MSALPLPCEQLEIGHVDAVLCFCCHVVCFRSHVDDVQPFWLDSSDDHAPLHGVLLVKSEKVPLDVGLKKYVKWT